MIMRRRRAIEHKYPVFEMFGAAAHRRLTPEEARVLPFEVRLASVWHYLSTIAMRFHGGLSATERVNLDPEDMLIEIYAKLQVVDRHWQPDLGLYKTFATVCARRCLANLREKSRTVHSPHNAGRSALDCGSLVESGDASDRDRAMLANILRTMDFDAVDDTVPDGHPGAEALAERDELRQLAHDAIHLAASSLSYAECQILGELFGIGSHESKAVAQVARRHRTTTTAIIQAVSHATRIMHARLRRERYPAGITHFMPK